MNVRIQIANAEVLNRANLLLQGVPRGLETALREASKRANTHLRSESGKEIRERYAISQANIRAEENIKSRVTTSDGVVMSTVTFSGHLIPLFRFNGTTPLDQTPIKDWTVIAPVHGVPKRVHPSVAAKAHQLKGTSPQKFQSAFTARMSNGHVGIFERTGGVARDGSDAIHEIMGSSVAQMVGSDEVATNLSNKAMERFDERLEHEIQRLLSGIGG